MEYNNLSMIKPIDFAVDGGNRLRALSSLWRLYPDYSLKRRLLKALNGLNQLSIRARPKSMNRVDRVNEYLPELITGGSRAFLLNKIDQNGRVYIFDHNLNGQLTLVTKLALNPTSAKGLHREAAVLRNLAGRTLFQIPELKAFVAWDDGCLIQVSATPCDQFVFNKHQDLPEELFDAIATLRSFRVPNSLAAGSFDGWKNFRNKARIPEICHVADEIRACDKFEVAAAHQDLGSENIFCRPSPKQVSDFTLIDWEFFSESAPALTDRVGVWLGRHHRALKGLARPCPNALAVKFLNDFESASGGKRAAVLALLHLADLGIDLACYLTGERE